jgi:hypothetical protein
MRQLDKFVRSPIHNQHEEVIKLFLYFRRHLSGNENGLRKEKVHAALFHGADFDMQKVHYISSYLLRVVEEFMAWQQWQSDDFQHQLSLFKSLRLHHLESLFEAQIVKAKNGVSSANSTQTLEFEYHIQWENFVHNRFKTGKQELRLQELSDSLDAYYIAEKLRIACILLSNQSITKTQYDTGLLANVLQFVEGHSLLQHPIISMYYHASKTIQNHEDDEAFNQLKAILTQYHKSLSVNELYDIFVFAANYCIRRMNMGEQQFMQEVFDIYRMGMDIGAFIQNGVMVPRTYSNIVFFGLRMGQQKWVEEFIYQNKDVLPEKQRIGYFNYNLARLFYENGRFGEAMPLLLQMEYDDALLVCLGRVLLAKMYFEQGESESLSSLLSSFKIYVQRKKIPPQYQVTYLNFINFLNRFLLNPTLDTEKLAMEIAETKGVAEKDWLLAQLQK